MSNGEAATRSPAEIRASIEANRAELGRAVQTLHGEVARLTDWRAHLEKGRVELAKHRKQVLIGAAVTGFVMGGGLAALRGLRRKD